MNYLRKTIYYMPESLLKNLRFYKYYTTKQFKHISDFNKFSKFNLMLIKIK